jgi:hypothetical protein
MKQCLVFLFWAALGLGACQPGPNSTQTTDNQARIDSLDTASFIKNSTEPTRANAAELIAQAEVSVVDDPDEVSSLRQKLSDNAANSAVVTADGETSAPGLVEQWVAAQPGAATALAQQLMVTGEASPRSDLLSALANHVYQETLPPLSDDLSQAVIACLADTAVETSAASVLAHAKPVGWQAALENRLRSGQSTDASQLATHLGQGTWSPVAFTLARNQIASGQAKPAQLAQWFECLGGSLAHGPDSLKPTVLAIATRHVTRLLDQAKPAPINPSEDGLLLDEERYYGDPYHGAGELVCKLGGRAELPLIHRLRGVTSQQATALAALVRLEGSKHKALILSFLRNQQRFSAGLDAAVALGPRAWDDRLGTFILSQLDNQSYIYQHNLTSVVQALAKLGQVQGLASATPWLRNRDLARKIQFYHQLNSTDLAQLAESLYNLGLVPARLAPAQVAQAQQASSANWGGTGIVHLLQATGRLVEYEYPDDDEVSTQQHASQCYLNFAKLMPFADAQFGVEETNGDPEGYGSQYKLIYSVTGRQAFTTLVSDTDKIEYHLVALLNQALAYNNYTQRFVPISPGEYTAGYFYGDEARVGLLVSKWGLEWQSVDLAKTVGELIEKSEPID